MDKAPKHKDVPSRKAEASPVEKRKPVAVIRADDCSASIWARDVMIQGQPKVFYSVTLERSYKDRDGAWKYTRSFDPDSLGKVVSLCQQAAESIHGLQQQNAA